jgi:glutathionyl-hydroquinone reductase
MGMLVDGEWQDAGYETSLTGHFERRPTTFRNWVTADGSPGPTGRRLRRREKPVSSVCQLGLSLGAPHPDHAPAERP